MEPDITTTNELTAEPAPLLPGRPLMTIATVATTAAFVLTSVAAAGLTIVGALPPGFEEIGVEVSKWSGVAGAISLGLGGLGKALYGAAVAKNNNH